MSTRLSELGEKIKMAAEPRWLRKLFFPFKKSNFFAVFFLLQVHILLTFFEIKKKMLSVVLLLRFQNIYKFLKHLLVPKHF
jgi:hypothetical protein